jgi:uncharacterized RDD family membrane protein YckC
MTTQSTYFTQMDDSTELEYVGFWLRLGAGLVDSFMLMMVLVPLTIGVFGWSRLATAIHVSGTEDLVATWILPGILILTIWTARHRSRGMAVISAVVLDERTSSPPSFGQHVGRYLGYFLAVIPFGLGLVWVAFDSKKQGWHDKLAGTIVVRPRKRK